MSEPNSLAAASAAALDSLTSAPAAATETPTPSTSEGQVSTETTSDTPPPSVTATLNDDTPITIKVNGKDETVSLKELREMGMRQSDYTRKTQELATQRREIEESVRQAQDRERQYQAFLNDPTRLGQYYTDLLKATGHQAPQQQAQSVQQQQQFDPNGLLTGAEATQLMEARLSQTTQQLAQLEQKFEQRIAQRTQELETNTRAAKYEQDINTVIESVLKEHPDLEVIENVAEKLCMEAMKFQPKTLEEAKSAILNSAKAQQEKLDSRFKERLKSTAVQQTKLKDQGIEPPGGTAVTPQPKQFKLGSKDLTQAVTSFLQSTAKK